MSVAVYWGISLKIFPNVLKISLFYPSITWIYLCSLRALIHRLNRFIRLWLIINWIS